MNKIPDKMDIDLHTSMRVYDIILEPMCDQYYN